MQQVDAIKEFKLLQAQRDYKSANDLYKIATENEKMVTGIQHDGSKLKNLKPAVYNILGQITSIKNASILANELTTMRSAYAEDGGNKEVELAVKAFNLADNRNWERLKMNDTLEQVVFDGSICGLGLTYWYWDDELELGNTHKIKGDIAKEIIDSTDLYVSNPSETKINKQSWIKLVRYMTVAELKEYAKSKGMDDTDVDSLSSDEQNISYRAYDKSDSDNQSDNPDKLTTLVLNFKKIDGKIWKSETTEQMVIEDWKDIDMTVYPFTAFAYKPRKSFFYGEAEVTRYIENQKIGNMQASIRHAHAKLMGLPKVLINNNMTTSYSAAVGSVNKCNIPPGSNLDSAMKYVQPAAMSMDVDKSIDESFERTMQLAGVGQTLQASARPENAAALLTQIKQASIPIEPYKKRLYQYIEDTLCVWAEFYTTKYNVIRTLRDENKEDIEFTGTDYKGIKLNSKIEVGPSTQWSDVTSFQMLMDLWDRQLIPSNKMILKRLPDNAIKEQGKLMEEIEDEELIEAMKANVIQQLPPELQQEYMEMPPEEQSDLLKHMLGVETDEV